MDLFDFLTLIGGLSLFLFGMNVMGQAIERRAGNQLKTLLSRITTKKSIGILTGLVFTAAIQSSTATSVMVVGFVNSGLMTLQQGINVIMGANVGTTITAWILSLGGINGTGILIRLLRPSSFTPVLALIGVSFLMFSKNNKRKDTGTILLGFATLMFGMQTMADAVSGLADVPAFQNLCLMFRNPVMGVLAGVVIAAVIQSSSAAVGILQALAVTGAISYGAAVPIIMGENIGACMTALLSSVGTSKDAKRVSLVHLAFNVIGTAVWLAVFLLIDALLKPALLSAPASMVGIAVIHSGFKILCLLTLAPVSGLFERMVTVLVPDDKKEPEPQPQAELDERLMKSPPVALERCRTLAVDMARCSQTAFTGSLLAFQTYDKELAAEVRRREERTDHLEDAIGTYLVKLSALPIGEEASREAAGLIKMMGDWERIADHAVNLLESAEEMREKDLRFSDQASAEIQVLCQAVTETLRMAEQAFENNALETALRVEPLEQVVDNLKELLRLRHILRLQKGECGMGVGFVLSDILTNLERVSDHCSNIAACVIDMSQSSMNMHETIRANRSGSAEFERMFREYSRSYSLPELTES